MTTERQAVKVLAEEMMKAIKKVTDDNNKSYVANQIKNYNGGAVIGGGGSGGGSISGNINASQVSGLYNAVANYIVNAPANASSGDQLASNIMSMFQNTIDARFGSITVDTAQIKNLEASYANFINLVAQKATIQDLDVEKVYADLADIGMANISSAKIGYGQIKDLTSDTAIIREGVGNRLFIDRLAVSDANMVSLTTGELMIKDSEGDFARIVVDGAGNVSSQKVTFDGDGFINNNSLSAGKIVENSITARELNVGSIFADSALIGAIKAANIDISDLFANQGFITALSTSSISAPNYDLSNNQSVINLTQGMIDMIVTSETDEETHETRFTLTDKMINAISDQVTFSADNIEFEASQNFSTAVSNQLKEELGYRLEIISTGDILSDAIQSTILYAKVYQGKNDVTSQFASSQFNWKRTSNNSASDTTWNNSHKGMKQVTIGTGDVDYSATFSCELEELEG